MPNSEGRKTELAYWANLFQSPTRARLPSSLNVGIRDIKRLLKRHVKPGNRYLEIGCAPGKMLAWVAAALNAKVSGMDYSEPGIRSCRELFRSLGLTANLFHADLFEHPLTPASFDIVTSFGVIEHFDAARLAVRRHLDLVTPGGLALITVPNYGGIYRRLQAWCDPSNLRLHNLEIMSKETLEELANFPDVESKTAIAFGAVSPWLVNLGKRLPLWIATGISYVINGVGLLQPMKIGYLAPYLALKIRKVS